MDVGKLFEIAVSLGRSDLVRIGAGLVGDVVAAAARAPDVLSSADRAELDAIHADALTAADELDAALAAAERS